MSRLLLAIRAIDSAASIEDMTAIAAEIERLDRRRAWLVEIRDGITERIALGAPAAAEPDDDDTPAKAGYGEDPPAASPPPAYVEPGRIAPPPSYDPDAVQIGRPAARPAWTSVSREDADSSSLASKIHDLIDEEGSLPVTVVAKRLGRTVQGVRMSITKSGWFHVGPDDEVRIAKR